MENQLKCLFVQHPFHFKSKSSQILDQQLKFYGYEIDRISRDKWDLSKAYDADLIIAWQSEHILVDLNKLGERKVVVAVPMIDDMMHRTIGYFRELQNIRFLAFSYNLYVFLKAAGCNVRYLKFMPKPPNRITNKDFSKIYFWERTPEHLNIQDLLKVFSGHEKTILYRPFADSSRGIKHVQSRSLFSGDARVQIINSNWSTRNIYDKSIGNCGIFIAPRKFEGIGLSMLEAMSNGMVLAGLPHPTLSEYVESGMNGLLIRKLDRPLGMYDFEKIQANSINFSRACYQEYSERMPEVVLSLISDSQDKKAKRIFPTALTFSNFLKIKNLI